MRYVYTVMLGGLVLLVACQAFAQVTFDTRECKADCMFQYNVRRDWGGGIQLPFDTPRREGYLKCVDECDNKFWQDSFGPRTN